MPPEYHTPKTFCPQCGRLLDGAMPTPDHTDAPHEGAVSLCAYCGGIAMYDENLMLRKMTEAEYREVMNSEVGPMLRFAQHKIREIGHRRRAKN
jgi:hypothetical protein